MTYPLPSDARWLLLNTRLPLPLPLPRSAPITSAGEDGAIGRKGTALARAIGGAALLEVPETDPLGLSFHIGDDRTAKIIAEVLATGTP